MTITIDQPIVGYEVVAENGEPEQPVSTGPFVRPDTLIGVTYKIKPMPLDDALYITINADEEGHPREVFINTKGAEHHQWIVGLTRMISAVLRLDDQYKFIAKELQQVADPNGGYWGKAGAKGKFFPSIVAHVGWVLAEHWGLNGDTEVAETAASSGFPESATVCKKCNEKAVVIKDGCATCLNCGDSKCG